MSTTIKTAGFTLLELMIVVAIIGIIAAFAVPSYNNFVCNGRKTDAHTTLMNMAQAQERYYLQNSLYAGNGNIAQVGGTGSAQGFYTMSIEPAADSAAFTLVATDVNAAGNLCDAACGQIRLGSGGQRTPAACW